MSENCEIAGEVFYHLERKTYFVPDYTILVRLSFFNEGNIWNIKLSDAEIHHENDIRKFLKNLLKDPHPKPVTIKKPSDERPRALGIPVDAPANVVIVLDTDTAWRFRKGKPAITAKGDYGDSNWGSWHVDEDGEPVDIFPAGCKIAYFSVANRPALPNPHAVQSFNFHLELQQEDRRWVEIIIDPDVPEVGGEDFPSKLRILQKASRPNSVVRVI